LGAKYTAFWPRCGALFFYCPHQACALPPHKAAKAMAAKQKMRRSFDKLHQDI